MAVSSVSYFRPFAWVFYVRKYGGKSKYNIRMKLEETQRWLFSGLLRRGIWKRSLDVSHIFTTCISRTQHPRWHPLEELKFVSKIWNGYVSLRNILIKDFEEKKAVLTLQFYYRRNMIAYNQNIIVFKCYTCLIKYEIMFIPRTYIYICECLVSLCLWQRRPAYRISVFFQPPFWFCSKHCLFQ